ncbi:MAG: hypothetical protein ACTHKK_11000 [Candidatus Nitrosocosmicus sp.]
MVIHIDLESLEENIKLEIIKDLKDDLSPNDNVSNNYFKLIYDDIVNNKSASKIKAIILEENEKHVNKIKHKLKEIFISKAIDDYIVVNDEINNNKLVILKRSQVESKGLYHCRHCGLEFEDEIQLGSHMRMHFFI